MVSCAVRWLRVLLVVLLGCGSVSSAREDFVINTLAEDNYLWALRDPQLVAMKLVKMQRDPFIWMRGTPAVYWRDISDAGEARAPTAFGDAASSRVLLVADPHPENIGSFRASDGTMWIDWNDFDSSGYGPYEADVRRLAAGMIVASHDAADPETAGDVDPAFADAIARAVAAGYAAQIQALALGQAAMPVTTGAAKYLDKLLAKGLANGDAGKDLSDVSEVVDGTRVFLGGDLDPVAPDGVVEGRLSSPDPIERARMEQALAPYLAHHPELGTLVALARDYGSGVSSYAALRYLALVSADRIIEIKEERAGLIVPLPRLPAAEWSSPAARSVDAQRRLQLRRDADALLGIADEGTLTFRIQDHASYQRGVNASDIGDLAIDPTKSSQVIDLAMIFGGLLARAHGLALTEDGVLGWTAIAPVLGDGASFAGEVSELARADAAQVISDWQMLRDEDLGARVIPARSD
jgi:uncharacterized protein (DUF2252 family)